MLIKSSFWTGAPLDPTLFHFIRIKRCKVAGLHTVQGGREGGRVGGWEGGREREGLDGRGCNARIRLQSEDGGS